MSFLCGTPKHTFQARHDRRFFATRQERRNHTGLVAADVVAALGGGESATCQR